MVNVNGPVGWPTPGHMTSSFRQPITPYPDKIGLRGRSKALDLQLTNEPALFARQRIATLRQELPHRGGMPAGPNQLVQLFRVNCQFGGVPDALRRIPTLPRANQGETAATIRMRMRRS